VRSAEGNMELERALEILEGLDLKERFGVRRIGFFGSLVRNEQKETSDIDVLVEFDSRAKTFDNYMNLKFLLEEAFGRKVDLVISDALKPQIRERVLEEAMYAEGS